MQDVSSGDGESSEPWVWSTLHNDNKTTVPLKVRKSLGLEKGSKIRYERGDGYIKMTRYDGPVSRSRGPNLDWVGPAALGVFVIAASLLERWKK